MSSAAQTLANQANAQHSTGPVTEEGKSRVAENRITHGLAGSQFRLLSWESPEQFSEFAATTKAEYNPQTREEDRLVHAIIQHYWLMQRALTLQDQLLTQPELDHKTFSLYLRYQTTNERAYYRARREFAAARKDQSKQQNGFESQKRQNEAQEAKTRLTNARAETAEIENYARSTMEVPLPGHIRVPFEDLTAAFRLTLQNLNKELATELTKQTAA